MMKSTRSNMDHSTSNKAKNEREKVRRRLRNLFGKAKEFSRFPGVDICMVVRHGKTSIRRREKIWVFNSSDDPTFPPTKQELVIHHFTLPYRDDHRLTSNQTLCSPHVVRIENEIHLRISTQQKLQEVDSALSSPFAPMPPKLGASPRTPSIWKIGFQRPNSPRNGE